jgi:hypothetical protein
MPNRLKVAEFIAIAKRIHGDKYDYSKTKYINSHTDIIITCPIHGDFHQRPNNHINEKGCPTCGTMNGHIKLKKSLEEFILASHQIHNNKYDYSKFVYKNNRTAGIIICPTHGEFENNPCNHLTKSQGCHKCYCERTKHNYSSQKEKDFLNHLKIEERQVYIGGRLVDGYDPLTETIYEFLGDYWHGNPALFLPEKINICNQKTFGELYDKTFARFNILKSMGYKIKYVWENTWDDFIAGNHNQLLLQSI